MLARWLILTVKDVTAIPEKDLYGNLMFPDTSNGHIHSFISFSSMHFSNIKVLVMLSVKEKGLNKACS